MTEAEWFSCEDPKPMLEFLKDGASGRKLRLFAVACCRRLWAHLVGQTPDLTEHCRRAVELTERSADGPVSVELLSTVDFVAVTDDSGADGEPYRSSFIVAGHVGWNLFAPLEGLPVFDEWKQTLRTAEMAARAAAVWPGPQADGAAKVLFEQRVKVQKAAEAYLLRDIFNNPFRPVTFDPSWPTPTVVDFAKTIYDDRAIGRMPELADALEEAGCTDADILSHCRGPGPHVRGCWVLDLVLGKA